MVPNDDPESQANVIPFLALTESFSTINASCEHALRIHSLSFEQVEQLALQTANTLAVLRRYQNTLVPVSKLPPELLGRVFEFVVAPTTANLYHSLPSFSQPVDSAVNIARVCSSWRAVALASSQLWRNVIDNDIAWPSRPQLFLERSRNSRIHVFTTLPDVLRRKGPSVWPTIIRRHADRVQELHLLVDRVFPLQDLLDLISSPLPSLELFTMTAGSNSFYIRSPHPPQLPRILGGAALNLKALALGPDASFIPGNSFPNLINLQLCGMGRVVEVMASDLLDLLSNSPRVETFELDSPIPDLERDARTLNRAPLNLSRLKALWMNDLRAASAFAFLAFLELPAVSTVRLTRLRANQWFSTPLIPLQLGHMGLAQLDILESGKPAGRDTPFALHFIAHGPGTPPRAGLWIHLLFRRPPSTDGRPLALPEQYAHEERVFWDVVNALPTRAVTALRLSTLRAAHLARAGRIVQGGGVPALENLVVRSVKAGSATEQGETLDALARALAPGDVDFSSEELGLGPRLGQSAGNVPAPRLRELTIELNRAWKLGMGDRLVRMLQERKMRGYPLQSVGCSALSVGDAELEGRIREHVVGEVKVTNRKLWEIRKVSELWTVKNDYWRLYPELLARGANGWGLPENT